MPNRRGQQKGAQTHAEGAHGEKAHRRFIEQLHEGPTEDPVSEKIAHQRETSAREGKRRLVEDREQHDEAEKNSEHTQLFAERALGRDQGPSDNTGNLHGVLGHRERRADNKPRGGNH